MEKRTAVALILGGFLSGCAAQCVVGQSSVCACPDGQMGAQVCGTDHIYGPCSCTGVIVGGGDMGGTTAPPGAKRVFVTAAVYPGDLKTAGNRNSGIAGADALCQAAAGAAGLGGTWRAWLSDSYGDGQGHGQVRALDHVTGAGPWYLLDGATRVFANGSNLATLPHGSINVTENVRRLTQPVSVWTGTENGGGAAGSDCQGWSSSSDTVKGRTGSTDGPENWTASQGTPTASCDQELHLYCFEM